MLYRTFLYFFILLQSQAVAQEWFPIGATWHYNQTIFFPPGNTYVTMEVTGETTIDGKLYRIISGGCFCAEDQGNYLHQDGDKIYRYDPGTDQSSLLYDFTLQPGDTMNYYSAITEVSRYLLDSITYIIIDTTSLRVQHFTWLEGWIDMGTTIYERIGSSGCLYPQIGFCDPGTGGLRCYEDTIIGLHKFIPPQMECDYVTGTLDVESSNLTMYPNPASDILTIESSNIISTIQLLDLSGNHITTMICQTEHCILDLQDYNTGMYFLKSVFTDGRAVVRKLIIAN